MEAEIYNLIKHIMYDQSIQKLYEKDTDKFTYPLKVEKLTFDTLDIFNKSYFDKYKEILIHNAAIFSIRKNDIEYINLFYKSNINTLIQRDKIVRAMITQRAFYNIHMKLKLNTNKDSFTQKNNKELYSKLTNINSFETLNALYRKLILNYLKNYNEKDQELILDIFLFSEELDIDFIKKNNYITKDSLSNFKNILLRIILSDNYLYLKSLEKDIDNFYDNSDENEEYMDNFDKEIIYILENDNYEDLNSHELRLSLYRTFIVYNVLIKEQKSDFKNISNNKNTIKTLKKINPLYFLDLF